MYFRFYFLIVLLIYRETDLRANKQQQNWEQKKQWLPNTIIEFQKTSVSPEIGDKAHQEMGRCRSEAGKREQKSSVRGQVPAMLTTAKRGMASKAHLTEVQLYVSCIDWLIYEFYLSIHRGFSPLRVLSTVLLELDWLEWTNTKRK